MTVFQTGQTVSLIDGRKKFPMTVVGQVKNYVALSTEDYIEVFTIYEYNGVEYLDTINDGGPTHSFKFKVG